MKIYVFIYPRKTLVYLQDKERIYTDLFDENKRENYNQMIKS